jgi:CheY-like chemotaxis protein
MPAAERKGILIVEDEQDLAELAAMLLEAEGHEVRTAANGAEALELVEQQMPALILLDLKMPVMDGGQFVRALRARYDDVPPIVVVSAVDDVRKRAQEIGADGWLSKPYVPNDLVRLASPYAPAALAPPAL